jgi:hypothetical protein
MALTARRIQGQLPNTKTTLYTVPASTQFMSLSIVCNNTGGSTQTIQFFLKTSSTSSRRIINIDVPAGASMYSGGEERFIIEATDVIEGQTTTASVVDYWISGIEITSA